MLGYWNDPEKTAEAFRNGWFHSGDLGVIDDEGYLSVVDRKKDMIKTGGENVASREVEEAIYAHPAVAEVASSASPTPRGSRPSPRRSSRGPRRRSPRTRSSRCSAASASPAFKVPKHIVLVDELPKNASGKILKRELRTAHADLAP